MFKIYNNEVKEKIRYQFTKTLKSLNENINDCIKQLDLDIKLIYGVIILKYMGI
jgi:hypothetical protein